MSLIMKFMSLVKSLALAFLALAAVCAGSASAQEIKAGDLVLGHAWARATPGGAQVGGGYLTIENRGTAPDKLLGGSSPAAAEVEVHEMAMKNDVMTMRPVSGGLSIPPGQTVTFAPGGYHIMMMGLKAPLKQGDRVPMTLQFEKAGIVNVMLDVQGVGALSPTSSEMDHAMPGMPKPMQMNSDHKM
jgi:copper(I)-binding protein